MVFKISLSLLPILLNSFLTGTGKVMCFLVFSPKQVNCTSNSSASFSMIKWYL